MLCEKLYCLQLVATNSISYIHIMPFKYKVIPPSQSVWVSKTEKILIIQNRWKGYSISWHRTVYSQKWKYVSIYWLTQVLMCSLFQHKIRDFDTSTFIVKQNVHVHMHLHWHKTQRNYISQSWTCHFQCTLSVWLASPWRFYIEHFLQCSTKGAVSDGWKNTY